MRRIVLLAFVVLSLVYVTTVTTIHVSWALPPSQQQSASRRQPALAGRFLLRSLPRQRVLETGAARQAFKDYKLSTLQASLWMGTVAGTAWKVVNLLAADRFRVPVNFVSLPLSEIAFGVTLLGTFQAIARSYMSSLASFTLRDQLLEEMAGARTYGTSVVPWIQTGLIALVLTFLLVRGVKAFVHSMKEWEDRQELREMTAMGEDAFFLMSTPIDATPIERRLNTFGRRRSFSLRSALGWLSNRSQLLRVGACIGYLLPLLNVLDFGEISVSLYPYPMGVPATEPVVNFMQHTLKMQHLYNAYSKSGHFFLIPWTLFIQLAVRNKAAPWFVRFHSSQAILMSMLLSVPQQIFFAVLNPWESGLFVQNVMYHCMASIFFFTIALVPWCCVKALLKSQMQLPLVSEAAVMWAGKV